MAILAVFYGRRVLLFMKDNGLVIISIVASLVLVGLVVYIFVNRRLGLVQATDEGDTSHSESLNNPERTPD